MSLNRFTRPQPGSIPGDTPRILIVNQHGDNRGDEAAMRAMIRRLHEDLDGAEFTVIHQFSDPASEVHFGIPVRYLPIRLPIVEVMRLVMFAVLMLLRIRLPGLLGPVGREVIAAYTSADGVISAPGGPYFGDLYVNHEFVHWFFVWLARLHDKRLFLYAPSAGPFQSRWMRPLRVRGYRWFDAVTLREDVSAEMVRGLMGRDFPISVTADSALQESVPASRRQDWTSGEAGGLLIVVSVRRPAGQDSAGHDAAIVDALQGLCSEQEAHVVFLPQLHGPRHRDAPYLQDLAAKVRGAASVRVADEDLDSDSHRALIAAADLVIAGRYHPAVFAVAAATPVVVIPYEHKAWGLVRAAGIEEWAIDVADLDAERLAQMVRRLVDHRLEVSDGLSSCAPVLMERARLSTDLAIRTLRRQ